AIPVSQCSPASTTPLPHTATQSASLLAVQPCGQQPSLVKEQRVTGTCAHCAVQVCALPTKLSVVHASPSLQLAAVGQDDGGSQVSPVSTTPLPQRGRQSASVLALQAAGQQPSAVMEQAVVALCVHWRVQPVPASPSTVQLLPSSQSATLCGQCPA